MKKILFPLLLLLFFAPQSDLMAQRTDKEIPHRHNIKLNLFSTILGFAPEVSYEYITAPESAFGVRGLFNLNVFQRNEEKVWSEDDIRLEADMGMGDIRLTPYYRWYFFGSSKSDRRIANGFYLEANASYAYLTQIEQLGLIGGNGKYTDKYISGSTLGIGAGLGGQFSTRKNWVFDFGAYIGRNFIYLDGAPIYGMVVISIGKRF